VLLICLLGGFLLLIRWLNKTPDSVVVAYISQDQVYAEPPLAEFTRQTGIRVRAVFDSEAVKTVAIANRLLAERKHPQCDVYWGNEELRTRQLEAQGLFRETNAWAAVGYRTRRLVVNTNLLALESAPRSLLELTNAAWRGRVAMAYPLFGTTSTHLLALRQRWGEDGWLNWCRALHANRPFVVDGNSVVVQFVSRGDAAVGLTDSDDIAAAQREGAPVAALPVGAETLAIPNTVAVLRGAPHPGQAEQLFVYLQRREVVERLVAARALEGMTPPIAPMTLQPDWVGLLRDLNAATVKLRAEFLR
jgi:iron(III) transport system substrate-binding protein